MFVSLSSLPVSQWVQRLSIVMMVSEVQRMRITFLRLGCIILILIIILLLIIILYTSQYLQVIAWSSKWFPPFSTPRDSKDQRITGMISSEKEVVPVKNPVDPNAARGNVELWLVEVEATWRLAVTVKNPGLIELILSGMKYYTIPIYVEGLFHTVSHEKRILFTNRWSVVFGSDTPQGFDSMEDFVETLTTRAKGGNILFCRMECFPKDFSHDIQKWSFPIEMGIYWSWSVWFLALNLETPTKRLEFLVTACFAIYEHVIYVTNCNNIPTKICHVSPQKSKKNHHDALLRLVRFTISETSAYFLCFLPDAGCQGCNDWNHSSCMPGIWEGPAWSDMMTAFQIQLANGVWYLGWY